MKTVIDRKLYDTDTARLVKHADFTDADGNVCQQALYRRRDGAFFLLMSGSLSKGSAVIGLEEKPELHIVPLSYDRALIWMTYEASAEEYRAVFTEPPDPSNGSMTVWLPVASAAKLRLAANRRKTTVQALIDEWIESL